MAQKQKSRTIKSPLMQDWVFRMGSKCSSGSFHGIIFLQNAALCKTELAHKKWARLLGINDLPEPIPVRYLSQHPIFFSYTFINLRIQYLISLEVRPLKLLLKSLIPIMDTFLHFLQFRSFSTLGDPISHGGLYSYLHQ